MTLAAINIKINMKKIGIIILIFVLLFFTTVWIVISFFPEKLVPFASSQLIKNRGFNNDLLNDKESITIYTLGTSSPFPGERAQTGTAVIVNGHFFMFDVGVGVVQKAENLRLPLNNLDGIFITHWHSDHFLELPYAINRSWVLGRTNDIHVYGPQGLDTLMQASHQLLHIENQHRVTHHGEEWMDITKADGISHEFMVEGDDAKIVYHQDGIKISAFNVDHQPIEPSVGYLIEYNGKKVVLSGDTKKSDQVLIHAQNADLLIHEVMLMSFIKQVSADLETHGFNRNAKITHDIQNYHTSPAEVAQIASEANVKKLVLHHFAPPPDHIIVKNLYKRKMKVYKGPIHFANDGDEFVIK